MSISMGGREGLGLRGGGGGNPHVCNLSLCNRQLRLQDVNLLLQRWYSAGATIHWISHPCVCLVHHRTHRIPTLMLWQLLHACMPLLHQLWIMRFMHGGLINSVKIKLMLDEIIKYLKHLVYIAGTKHLMDTGEFVGFISWKIRSKYAFQGTSPSEKFACSARGWRWTTRCHIYIYIYKSTCLFLFSCSLVLQH